VLYLVDKILDELLLRVPFDCIFQRVQQVQHARCNDGLLHSMALSIGEGLLEVVECVSLVPEVFSRRSKIRRSGVELTSMVHSPVVAAGDGDHRRRWPVNGQHGELWVWLGVTNKVLSVRLQVLGQASSSEGT
jgi:hypothetical protein